MTQIVYNVSECDTNITHCYWMWQKHFEVSTNISRVLQNVTE